MGNYCTIADLTKRFSVQDLIQLSDIESTGQINEDVWNEAIAGAESDIHAYIARRRTVPVTDPVALVRLRRMTGDWAYWSRHSDLHSVTEDLRKRHEEDVEWLVAYANGEVSLGDEADPAQPGTGQQSADTRVFTRDKMKGF